MRKPSINQIDLVANSDDSFQPEVYYNKSSKETKIDLIKFEQGYLYEIEFQNTYELWCSTKFTKIL